MLREIERKFLIDTLPKLSELNWLETQNIYQIYLATGREQIRARELVRGNSVEYTLTLKRGHGLLRDEVEVLINEDTYNQLRAKSSELGKIRHVVLVGRATVSIDIYHQLQLMVAEVEFPNEFEAKQFEPPAWFGKEITGVKKYENQYLWQAIQKN